MPAARGERTDPGRHAGAGPADRSGAADGGEEAGDHPAPTLNGLSVHDVLGQVPALVAVVYGPEHRIAYANDAYTALFGRPAPGAPAREALPELTELGLLPLMDQVLRSGRPRTVKSRRVPGDGFPLRHPDTAAATPGEAGTGTAAAATSDAAAAGPVTASAGSGTAAAPTGTGPCPVGAGHPGAGHPGAGHALPERTEAGRDSAGTPAATPPAPEATAPAAHPTAAGPAAGSECSSAPAATVPPGTGAPRGTEPDEGAVAPLDAGTAAGPGSAETDQGTSGPVAADPGRAAPDTPGGPASGGVTPGAVAGAGAAILDQAAATASDALPFAALRGGAAGADDGHPPEDRHAAHAAALTVSAVPAGEGSGTGSASVTARVPRHTPGGRDTYYTFTCTPIDVPVPAFAAPDGAAPQGGGSGTEHSGAATDGTPVRQHPASCPGVLVFGAEVTDQVEAAERLRASERRQREAAVTLQRSLLPQELEQPDDLRIAATYRPGGKDAAVGGDWYDVITLGAGRTALVIGDVMGRGVRAAAVMGQLRTAVRAYARLDLPPHEVLQLLDGLAAEIDASQIATCVYAVHDPNEGRLIYASAGHLPILVRDPDGTVRRAADPTGPPLGTGGWLHASGSVPLGPGSSAVLYTDGLVERRDKDIDDGVAALEEAFAGATGSPQVMCDRLIRTLGISADHDDDVAVLVLQHPARTGHDAELFHNAALELLGGVEAAPRARAFASGVLASWRFPTELRDLGVLAASELVANSLQHGTPPMRLRLRRTNRRLIIEVTDGDDHLPRRRRAEPGDETGRGISIIATIASSWGSRRTPGGGKAVWCEFALPTG